MNNISLRFMSMIFLWKCYLWVRGVGRGRVRQRLKWGRRCHASALATLLFIPLRPADPVVGRGRSAAAGLALRRGLLELLQRFLNNRGSTWQLQGSIGRWRPVGQSGLRLSAHTIPGNGQAQTTIHRLDLTQLCRLKFLWRRGELVLKQIFD